MTTLFKLACVAFVVAGFSQTPANRDWSEFRGPGRNAVLRAGQAPAQWPASFNRAWAVEVGEGYSSPVVSGGTVFIHSRKDPQESIVAIDVASG